jgi:hypothetical protein
VSDNDRSEHLSWISQILGRRFTAMRLLIGALTLFLLSSATVVIAQNPAPRISIESLQRLRSTTTWNSQSAKVADVDCDSKPDTIVLGSEKNKVVVGISWGEVNKQPQVFVFPIRRDQQDGFCVSPRKIAIEPLDCQSDEGTLPGCRAVKGCKAFSLNDDECDPFNFYWDFLHKKLAWWRL